VGAPDRSIRFVFDTVADAYASGRPDRDRPLEVTDLVWVIAARTA